MENKQMFHEIEILVDGKIFCWCDIRTLQESLTEAKYHYPRSIITWRYV